MANISKNTDNLNDINFEHAIAELTSIVEKVEQGKISLNDSLLQYEKGMGLIKQCRTILQQAEKRIQKIAQQDEIIQTDE